MRKIPSLWVRDFDLPGCPYTEAVNPGCEWVTAGEGRATRKWDGTCCLIKDGKLFARYDAKRGKAPPVGFIPAQPEADAATGHWPGWLSVGEQPQFKWHREALALHLKLGDIADGTYELVGPKVQANAESMSAHFLLEHGADSYMDVPRAFGELRSWLALKDIEGLVFHHPDGRMVKVTKQGYGLTRKVQS